MVLVEHTFLPIPNPTNSPLHLLTPRSGVDFHGCTYIQECYQHFESGVIFTCHGHKERMGKLGWGKSTRPFMYLQEQRETAVAFSCLVILSRAEE